MEVRRCGHVISLFWVLHGSYYVSCLIKFCGSNFGKERARHHLITPLPCLYVTRACLIWFLLFFSSYPISILEVFFFFFLFIRITTLPKFNNNLNMSLLLGLCLKFSMPIGPSARVRILVTFFFWITFSWLHILLVTF